jgi:hypothetical protein
MDMLTPVKGNKRIMEEQQQALREYQAALTDERNEKAQLVNLIARVLDDMCHHACVTDYTLRVMRDTHKRFTEGV